jgi:hypothetical protein
MSNAEDVDQFDELFAEIMAEGDSTTVAEVPAEPEVVKPLPESRETLIANLVAEPVEAAEKTEQKRQYRTVDKVEVEGGPCQSKVYPLGYVSLLFPGWRFANKVCFYLDGLKAFVEFCRSPQCDEWIAGLEKAGCRNRGEASKEG